VIVFVLLPAWISIEDPPPDVGSPRELKVKVAPLEMDTLEGRFMVCEFTV
jgi:hypothetical protein